MMFPYGMMGGGFPFFGGWFWYLLPVLILWEAVWKGVGLWRSAKNDQLAWFIAILVINSVGILPILYIIFFQRGRGKMIVIEPEPKKAKKKAKK